MSCSVIRGAQRSCVRPTSSLVMVSPSLQDPLRCEPPMVPGRTTCTSSPCCWLACCLVSKIVRQCPRRSGGAVHHVTGRVLVPTRQRFRCCASRHWTRACANSPAISSSNTGFHSKRCGVRVWAQTPIPLRLSFPPILSSPSALNQASCSLTFCSNISDTRLEAP